MTKEIEIPEGYEARIEGNKVVLEPKDSEDERIRKAIYSFVYSEFGSTKAEWLTYLEKQKEQKPAASWTIQDARPGDILNSARVQATIIFKGFNPDGKHIDAYCALQKGFFIAQELPWDRDFEPATQFWKDALFDAMVRKGYLWDAENKRLNKAVQKPAEKQDYSGLTDLERAIHRGFLSAGVENVPVTIIKETAQECLAQIKPAEWSEEDTYILGDAITAVDLLGNDNEYSEKHPNLAKAFRAAKDWLKSLPERFNLQPKQEWSEEDTNLLNRTLSIIRWASDSDRPNRIIGDAGAIELEDWLKSLRPQSKMAWRKYTWHRLMRFDKSALVKYDITGAYEIVTAGCRPRSEQNGIYVFLEDINPQPHWRPSEEQMNALKVSSEYEPCMKNREHLKSLYNDLKKL